MLAAQLTAVASKVQLRERAFSRERLLIDPDLLCWTSETGFILSPSFHSTYWPVVEDLYDRHESWAEELTSGISAPGRLSRRSAEYWAISGYRVRR